MPRRDTTATSSARAVAPLTPLAATLAAVGRTGQSSGHPGSLMSTSNPVAALPPAPPTWGALRAQEELEGSLLLPPPPTPNCSSLCQGARYPPTYQLAPNPEPSRATLQRLQENILPPRLSRRLTLPLALSVPFPSLHHPAGLDLTSSVTAWTDWCELHAAS